MPQRLSGQRRRRQAQHTAAPVQSQFRFLDLPFELREMIYQYAVQEPEILSNFRISCRLIKTEIMDVAYNECTYRVCWPENLYVVGKHTMNHNGSFPGRQLELHTDLAAAAAIKHIFLRTAIDDGVRAADYSELTVHGRLFQAEAKVLFPLLQTVSFVDTSDWPLEPAVTTLEVNWQVDSASWEAKTTAMDDYSFHLMPLPVVQDIVSLFVQYTLHEERYRDAVVEGNASEGLEHCIKLLPLRDTLIQRHLHSRRAHQRTWDALARHYERIMNHAEAVLQSLREHAALTAILLEASLMKSFPSPTSLIQRVLFENRPASGGRSQAQICRFVYAFDSQRRWRVKCRAGRPGATHSAQCDVDYIHAYYQAQLKQLAGTTSLRITW